MSTDVQRRWNIANRASPVLHAVGMALRHRVEDPYRLLAIAVVGLAFHDGVPVAQFWCDAADIDAGALGILVAA